VRHRELPGLVVPFKRPVYEAVIGEFEPFLRGEGLGSRL
jgi:hypothetical protein